MMNRSRVGFLLGVSVIALLGACRAGIVQGVDRPDDVALLGPPPPAEFGCTRGTRRTLDRDNDKKPDVIVWEVGGQAICRGEDNDRDLKVDKWQKLVDGKVVEEHEDTDRNGTLDTRRRDTDGNGTLDETTTIGPPAPPKS